MIGTKMYKYIKKLLILCSLMTSDSTSVYKEFKCVITVEDQRLKSKRLALNFEEK